mmetsp:Transcript_42319/g.58851  ORF Transcript_42319/g.58851 Transcript_42319/m.58851 type:complete len:93 (+) Transcript_42319:1683-1961(+)
MTKPIATAARVGPTEANLTSPRLLPQLGFGAGRAGPRDGLTEGIGAKLGRGVPAAEGRVERPASEGRAERAAAAARKCLTSTALRCSSSPSS